MHGSLFLRLGHCMLLTAEGFCASVWSQEGRPTSYTVRHGPEMKCRERGGLTPPAHKGLSFDMIGFGQLPFMACLHGPGSVDYLHHETKNFEHLNDNEHLGACTDPNTHPWLMTCWAPRTGLPGHLVVGYTAKVSTSLSEARVLTIVPEYSGTFI